MNRRRSRFAPALSVVNEVLESRVALTAGALHTGAAAVGALGAREAATHTTLSITAGTLGQAITFTATVRASGRAGAPQGTINLVDHGQVVGSMTLSPSSTSSRSGVSTATGTLPANPGGPSYWFGKHTIEAEFVPSGGFAKSQAKRNFTVGQPKYSTLSNGVQVATITQGSGQQLQAGQTASVLYTGYLEKNGQIFDDSSQHGGAPFSFTVGEGQVIPGFDAGVVGMQPGETRIVVIPPSQGYGAQANGSIPANSTLVFVLTLESIS